MVFKNGNVPWNKGLPKEEQPRYGKLHTNESKQKMGIKNLGRHPSEETRRKMSQSGKNRVFTETHRRNLSLALIGNQRCKGIRLSEEHKKKIGDALRGKPKPQHVKEKISKTMKDKKICAKENSPSWRGGISRLPYSFDFNDELKELIRRRDNYNCRECGRPQEKQKYPLSVHHINYDKFDTDPENLTSLCNRCHAKTNYNREFWTQYFQSELVE